MTLLASQPATPRKADPTKEYVSGGFARQYSSTRTLPQAIDDLTVEFGDDLYEQMLHDPQVAACVNVLRTGILEDGFKLTPAVDKEGADGYDQAKQMLADCERMLDDLETPLDDVAWDMLEALPTGNRVAEEVYSLERTYSGRREYALHALKVKPRSALAFEVNAFDTVIGLRRLSGFRSADDRAEVIERNKFAILTFRPHNNDPRGTSILRPAYNAWWLKMQLWPEYLKYLIQFASPSLDGEVAPPLPGHDVNEVPEYDAEGKPTGQYISAEVAYLNQLVQFRNGTAMVRPSGSKLNVLSSEGDGTAFLKAFELYNTEITKAIVHQTLATNEAKFGTRAQSSTHQDVLDSIIRQAKKSVCLMMRRDVLRQIVRYNYGADKVELTPFVSLGDVEEQDRSALITAMAKAGFALSPEHLPTVDVMLGLPPRTVVQEQIDQPEVGTDPDDDPDGDEGGEESDDGDDTSEEEADNE